MCNIIETTKEDKETIECAIVYQSPSQTHMIGVVYEDKNIVENEAIKYPNSFSLINNFLKEQKYKSPYFRFYSTMEGITTVDVGSWNEFFYILEEFGQSPDKYIAFLERKDKNE